MSKTISEEKGGWQSLLPVVWTKVCLGIAGDFTLCRITLSAKLGYRVSTCCTRPFKEPPPGLRPSDSNAPASGTTLMMPR